MTEEKVLLQATLCFPVGNGRVLLAKKMKKIGAGFWNGYGGGIEGNETPLEAAVRELREECGLVAHPEHMKKVAVVNFTNTKSDGNKFVCQVHVFLARSWTGEPNPTDEMQSPTWFDLNELPLEEMMAADRMWLPTALRGQMIVASASYGPFQKELLGPVSVKKVDRLP